MSNNLWNDASGRYPFKTVGIREIDEATVNYFQKRLALSVEISDGKRRVVPVILATGERWSMIRDRRGIRDENKTLILPLITVQRLDIDRTLGFGGLGLETPSITISKRIHPETNIKQNLYQQRNKFFPTARKNKKIYEILTIPFPDFCSVYYQVMIWAQYMSQMNEMLEKIFYMYDHADSFVMPMEYDKNNQAIKGNGRYFVGFRETTSISAQNNFEEFTDDERIIRYQYNIKVPAYFILDPKDKPLSYGKDKGGTKNDTGQHIVYKQQTADEIVIEARNERVLTTEEIAKLFNIVI